LEINTLSDIDVFWRGIDSVADWASRWQLRLASAKCQFIRVGRRKCNPAKYSLSGSTVPKSTVVTELGIKIDSRLLFTDHVDHIVSKAKLRASQILWCFVSKHVRILTRVF